MSKLESTRAKLRYKEHIAKAPSKGFKAAMEEPFPAPAKAGVPRNAVSAGLSPYWPVGYNFSPFQLPPQRASISRVPDS